ncbi:MAG: FimB/Mfa2 family fimbrial subunit [Alistipes sp.]|jgi:hypothetical protein|nr:FimB/Mfa2 family fimbrial subunit [Alistipes sp.]
MLKKKILILLSALFLSGGCVRASFEDCGYFIRINFAFTNNPEGTNQLAASIQDIRVYIYDSATGILAAVFRASPDEIDRGYMLIYALSGSYTVVAWASSNPDMFDNFDEGVTQPPTPPPPPPEPGETDSLPPPPPPPPVVVPVTPGQTPIGDTNIGLDTNPGTGGNNIPRNDQFGDLFHDSSEDEVSRPNRDLPDDDIEMDFNRMSSLLDIRIRGLQYLPANVQRPPHVFVEGRNGALTPTGNVATDAPPMHYEPYDVAANANEMEVRMQTLKLQMNMENTQPMMLHIQDRATGRDIVPPMNLITLIRNVRRADGTYPYRTQADIDRESEFRIMLDVTPEGGVSVSVNDFIVEQLVPILFTWN